MKRLKKMMALVIAVAMVLSMNVAAFADPVAAETGDGSITISSPVVGANYTAYRVFDMTSNATYDSFSYTIKTNSPFYAAVTEYANAADTADADGLTLTASAADATVYNVTVDSSKFDAQKFGQFLEGKLSGLSLDALTYTPAYEQIPDLDEEGNQRVDSEGNPLTKSAGVVTAAKANGVTFENLPFGYYLIIGGYPTVNPTVSLEYGEEGDPGYQKWEFTKDSTTQQIEAAADEYVAKVVTDDYVNAYIADPNGDGDESDSLIAAKEATGEEWTQEDWDDVKKQLEETTKADAIAKINAGINKLEGDESDINVQTQRLVFVDSTTPDAVINEKNEIDKWDVPVNPEGSANVEGLPDHGEPDGGKNIIVGYADAPANTKPIYADWTEANIGDTINYEIRVNAMNFIRHDDVENDGDKPAINDEFSVDQVKEYIIGDYQNDSLTFDPQKDHITVSIIDSNGNKLDPTTYGYQTNYTNMYKNFFVDEPADPTTSIFDNGGGILIPWVTISKTAPAAGSIYITNVIEKKDDTGATLYQKWEAGMDENLKRDENGFLLDRYNNKIPQTDKYYVVSKFPSDVTIVVNYTMTLTNKATIDGNGNINYGQYGMNYVDKEDTEYTPDITGKPGKPYEESTPDTAKVYTYALAIQKVDNAGNHLAGATFAVTGLKEFTKLGDGYYKVEKYNPEDTTKTELVADKDGLLVIEGFESSAELEITELQAPEGFNILTKPVTLSAQKNNNKAEVISNVTTTYYDENDNKIGTTTSATRTVTYYDADGTTVKAVATTKDGVTTYEDGNGDPLTESQFQDTIAGKTSQNSDGKATTNLAAELIHQIENKQGTELPSTGGIGTTIFYVVGAILVIGAGVVLITRRRMDA